MTDEPKMWIGLHTGPPKIEPAGPLGLGRRVTGAFARADVDDDERARWSAPLAEPTPIRIVLADGSWADHTISVGGPLSVTHLALTDAPAGGSMQHLQPTSETVVDDDGVTRQVWREAVHG